MRRAMLDEIKEDVSQSLGGNRFQKSGEVRTPESSQLLNALKITKPAMNKLELRKKINSLIRMEAEQRYISTTNSVEPAFETANLKYLAAERGRNFGRMPSHEFKKEVLIRMLNRRNNLDSAFSSARTTPEMSLLIDVALA